MIELIDTESDHVLGVRAKGELSSKDVSLGMSFIEEKIRTRKDIALYVDVTELDGALPEAITSEIRHSAKQLANLKHIRRLALVTKTKSMHDGWGIEDLVPVIDVKTFSSSERDAAEAWASESV